mgnify:CR=1 FL=1
MVGRSRLVTAADESSAREVLRRGELTVLGRIRSASNATFLCEAADGERTVHCVYKPVAGEQPLWDFPDGTLAGRFKGSPAQRNAFLKTGTLTGVRSLAGYVRGQSGQMIAVAIVVNSEQAGAAVPALDKFIEWVRQHG